MPTTSAAATGCTQPLPTILAWYMDKLPAGFQRASTLLVFDAVVEALDKSAIEAGDAA